MVEYSNIEMRGINRTNGKLNGLLHVDPPPPHTPFKEFLLFGTRTQEDVY